MPKIDYYIQNYVFTCKLDLEKYLFYDLNSYCLAWLNQIALRLNVIQLGAHLQM